MNNFLENNESKTRLFLPVKSFKRFDNPYNLKLDPAKYQFFVNAKDLPEELENWLKVNPREQNLKTSVSKDIQESLLNSEENFHLLNRGLLISVEEIKYDNKTGFVEIVLSNIEKHGIVDGGHTFKCVLKEKPYIQTDKFINIEVIENLSVIEQLAEARNTSVAVDEKSIEELKGSFDCFKEIIEHHKIGEDFYYNRIAFKQNEYRNDNSINNIIDVREIIAISNMFNPHIYNPNIPSHPIQSYTGKEVSLKKFLNLSEKIAGTTEEKIEYRNNIVKNMGKVIKDIFELWDIIETEFPDVSRDLNKRYGFKKYSNYNNDRIEKVSLFSNRELTYTIPRGIMYPCLGSFRALINFNQDTGEINWTAGLDPFHVWNEKKEFIVNTILDNSKPVASDNPEYIGKSMLIWDSLYKEIYIYKLEKNHK